MHGVKMKYSNIQYESFRYGVYFGRPFGAGKIVGYYYGKLVYANLKMQKQVRRKYGDGGIPATAENFLHVRLRFRKLLGPPRKGEK